MQHNGRYFANNALHKTLFCTELNYTAQALTRLNGHRKDKLHSTGTYQIKWPQKRQSVGMNRSSEPKLQRLAKRTILGISVQWRNTAAACSYPTDVL